MSGKVSKWRWRLDRAEARGVRRRVGRDGQPWAGDGKVFQECSVMYGSPQVRAKWQIVGVVGTLAIRGERTLEVGGRVGE